MILVFGKTGQVAIELQRIGNVIALSRDQADLSNPQLCADIIRAYAPKAVINAAAYTAVDKAEKDEPYATIINGYAPTAIAKVCAELNIPLIHISTDYVFLGTENKPWTPKDTPSPKNAYGRSKLIGENGIRSTGVAHVILRTSWIFSAHGTNFVKTMLKLSDEQKKLRVVYDQIGGPTPAKDIALGCLDIANQLIQNKNKSGTYHLSGTPDVSWADFTKEIFNQANRSIKIIQTSSEDYKTPALRPTNSRLNCSTTERIFGIKRPDWRIGLKVILKELEVIR